MEYEYQAGLRDVRLKLETRQVSLKARHFELANAQSDLPTVQLPVPIH